MFQLTLTQFTALFAGFAVMLVNGSLYVFGTMSPYILTNLYYHDQKDIHISDLSIINTLAIICTNLGIFIKNFKIFNFSNRITVLITVVGISAINFTLSFCHQFFYYVIFYGILLGFFVGFGYLAPIKNCYDHLPNRKGLCTGTCMMGFGLGALIFNFILVGIVNPDNESKQKDTNVFPKSIGEHLPLAFQVLSGVYIGIGLLGVLLTQSPNSSTQVLNPLAQVSPNQSQDQEQSLQKQNHYSPKSIKHAIGNKVGWLLAILAFCVPFGLFVAFNFKEYGLIYQLDDHYLSLLGSLGSVGNGVFRIVLGIILDFVAFKTIMLINLGVLIVSCATFYFSVHSKVSYLFSVVLSYGCYGGLYSIFPTQTVRVLGRQIGSKMYYFTFIGFSLGSLIQYFCHKYLVQKYKNDGYIYCFIIFGVLLVLSAIIVFAKSFKLDKSQAKLLQIPGHESTIEQDSIKLSSE